MKTYFYVIYLDIKERNFYVLHPTYKSTVNRSLIAMLMLQNKMSIVAFSHHLDNLDEETSVSSRCACFLKKYLLKKKIIRMLRQKEVFLCNLSAHEVKQFLYPTYSKTTIMNTLV